MDKTVPGQTAVLSDPGLVSSGLLKEDESSGRSLIEGTDLFMDQNPSAVLPVVQESCCEKDHTSEKKAVSELDLAPLFHSFIYSCLPLLSLLFHQLTYSVHAFTTLSVMP